MAFSGAVYQIIDQQRIDGEEILNVYFYSNSGVSTVAEVATLFEADVLTLVNDIQSVDLVHETLIVRNILTTDADAVITTGDVGAQNIEAFPRAVAANYTLRPASRLVRPGSKRYGGIPENASNHNVWNNALLLPAFEALRVQLSLPLVGTLSSYLPVVVKRIPYTTPQGNPAYRLPATQAEADVFNVIGALFDINVSHQVSRGN